MGTPDFVIGRQDRTPGRSLAVRDVQIIARILRGGGCVMLPSDTAYSVAVLAVGEQTRKRVNRILRRPDIPISLAFPSVTVARKWVAPNKLVEARLAAERLSEKRAAILFLRLAIGRPDATEAAQILAAGTAMFMGHH